MRIIQRSGISQMTAISVKGKLRMDIIDLAYLKDKYEGQGEYLKVVDGSSEKFKKYGVLEDGKKTTELYFGYLSYNDKNKTWSPVTLKEAISIYQQTKSA